MYLMPMLVYLRNFPESGKAMVGAMNLSLYFETHAERASFRATAPPRSRNYDPTSRETMVARWADRHWTTDSAYASSVISR